MRQLETQLGQLLASRGVATKRQVAYPQTADLRRAKVAAAVVDVYRNLGGVMATPSLRLRGWDIEFDGCAVELDECLHFNRYRLLTLESPAYALLPGFPLDLYRSYYSGYESECLKAGAWSKRWSSDSCNAQFGVAASPKDFSGNGSSRWKQRAFYDFVKDLSPEMVSSRLVRIAVWDNLEDERGVRSIASALQAPSASTADALVRLVRSRAIT